MGKAKRTLTFAERATRYARRVAAGKIPNCKWAILASKRHLRDLEREGTKAFPYVYDHAAANAICEFAEEMPHVKGKWARDGETIKLQDWQCFILCVLFGWLHTESGLRRFNEAYIEIPRKNGKSVLAAIIGLYMFCLDDEFGAEVYSGATSQKQAWEVFRPAKAMFEHRTTEDLRALVSGEVWARSLVTLRDGSRFEPIIGKPGDGASPHCAIADEYHEHDTSDQYDTMKTGMGAREQPLMLVITTAGVNIAGPCFQARLRAQRVLEDTLPDDLLFAIIYSIDLPESEDDDTKADDWADPKVIYIANPNLGVSVSEEFLLSEQRQAVLSPEKQTRFKTKHLNVWCGARNPWMPMVAYNMCGDKELEFEEFKTDGAWFMLDLASKLDLAFFGQLFKRRVRIKGRERPVDHYYSFGQYYAPHGWVYNSDNPNSGIYQKWEQQGLLTVHDGEEIDFDLIEQDVLEYRGKVGRVREVVYDPWRATQMAQRLTKERLLTVEMKPTVENYSPAMKEILAAVRSGRWHHDGNPITAWCFNNVSCKRDKKENIFPVKENEMSPLKIDGAVGNIMGVARAMLDQSQPSIDDWLSGGPVVVTRRNG